MFNTRKTLEKSALRLVRTTFLKIKDGDKTWYLQEKCYASEYDGTILVEEITEKQFNKAVLKEKKIEVSDLENARMNIQREILELKGERK